MDDAVATLDLWLGADPAVVVEPTKGHLRLVAQLLAPIGTVGNLFNDAHLAALAIEHRATVVSHDLDFGRFPDVR